MAEKTTPEAASLEAPDADKPSLQACIAEAEEKKRLGNEKLKLGTKSGYQEARALYSEGIKSLENAATLVHGEGKKDQLSDEDRLRGGVLLSVLFSNRAHVRMSLRDHAGCVDDARRAFSLDSGNVKAYWRAAKASLSMELYKNAAEFAELGLAVDASNADLQKLCNVCTAKLEARKSSRRGKDGYTAQDAADLQESVSTLHTRLQRTSMALQEAQREAKRSEFVKNALENHPNDLPAYRKVGRVFVRAPNATLIEESVTRMQQAESAAPQLASQRADLESRVQEAEGELRSCIQAFKQQQQQQRQQQQKAEG